MPWVIFLISAVVIAFAAMQLAKYGDIIALRTGLGGMFVGVLLMAGATSLPEVLTSISSLRLGLPNMAAGNLLGSNMFNMFLLALLDLVFYKQRILRNSLLRHALSGSLTIFLISLAIFFIMADFNVSVGWMGVDSLILIMVYIGAIYLIQKNLDLTSSVSTHKIIIPPGTPKLRSGFIGFLLASALLVATTPYLVSSSKDIAEITGLGTTFVGTTLVALVTSLPELATTLAAAKIGAADMAVGNLFGSNMFNIFALGLTDVFLVSGRFLGVIDPVFLLVAVLGLLMTGLALIGNIARLERKIFFLEIDAFILIVLYIGGLVFLYYQGIGS